MQINKINIGFVEVPTKICLNIYVQGCKFNCKDCQNPQLQPFDSSDSHILDDSTFHSYLSKHRGFIEAICWLGGDAIFQPNRLIELSNISKEYGLKSILYTGELYDNIPIEVKDSQDGIIDGLFNGYPIGHGKCNQSIYVCRKGLWFNCTSLKELSANL